MPKNYRNPSSFFAMFNHENMDGFTLQAVGEDSIAQMGQIIDGTRHVNCEDQGFLYTCMCEDDITQWMFAYTNKNVCMRAKAIAKNMFNEIFGTAPTGMSASLPHAACACPLAK